MSSARIISAIAFMAFDEQLTRAFETLTARLRGEIDQEVVRRIAALPPTPGLIPLRVVK